MQVYGSENLLRENDHIISVNDKLTSSMNNEEIRNALKEAKLLLVVKRYSYMLCIHIGNYIHNKIMLMIAVVC